MNLENSSFFEQQRRKKLSYLKMKRRANICLGPCCARYNNLFRKDGWVTSTLYLNGKFCPIPHFENNRGETGGLVSYHLTSFIKDCLQCFNLIIQQCFALSRIQRSLGFCSVSQLSLFHNHFPKRTFGALRCPSFPNKCRFSRRNPIPLRKRPRFRRHKRVQTFRFHSSSYSFRGRRVVVGQNFQMSLSRIKSIWQIFFINVQE
mmetsp:Transcript_21586/g.59904  ORF Transcript_21586/g.59904 Transcript_21586/m.59904 type:complete len:204 (-) Transcript_21586:924-1535(-)